MERHDDPTPRRVQIATRLLAVLAVLAVLASLRAASPVALPLAFALFLVAVFWPLQRRLARHLPRGIAALVALGVFLAVVAALAAGFWYSTQLVAKKSPEYVPKLRRMVVDMQSWASAHDLPFPDLPIVDEESGSSGGGEGAAGDSAAQGSAGAAGSGGSTSGSGRQGRLAGNLATRVLSTTFAAVSGFVLVLAFFVLGLLEVMDYRTKLARAFPRHDPRRWLDPLHRVTDEFLRYIAVRTGIGLLTGVLVFLFSIAVGLDFALIWGLTNFLLNYIPTIGSILGVIPPALFALVQFGGWKALLVAGGIAVIQLVMGNWVDPLVQGRYLKLSALVVLLSVTFWGWLWGVVGAFISVPLTVAIVIATRQFDRTRWIAILLASADDDGDGDGDGD